MHRIMVILFIVVVLVIVSGTFYCYRLINSPLIVSSNQTYLVASGSSLYRITHNLVDAGIVNMPTVIFRFYAMMTGSQGQLKAGKYDISEVNSPRELLALLRSGKVMEWGITFVEGWTFADWRKALDGEAEIHHQISSETDLGIMTLLGKPGMLPEGWFFPDTYHYTSGESDIDILRQAHRKMIRVLDENWQGRAVGNLIGTPYEALIIASMIEKETGVNDDRGRVARVFFNRLEQRMRLQSDPTVIYGLGSRYTGDLVLRHLKEDTPYNTYVNAGLPPTPIAMPGLASIQAALHPAAGEYLYFVAKGDGSSYFSKSLEEHNAAVERYQRSGRRKDYRSTQQQY